MAIAHPRKKSRLRYDRIMDSKLFSDEFGIMRDAHTAYDYARVSLREPEDKNLDLQVEWLVRVGCAMGNIRAQ